MKKSTWIVVGIFALLLAVFLLYPQIAPSKEEPVEPTATPHVLQSLDDQALKSIIYIGQDGEVVQLDKMDTLTWTVSSHPDGVVTAGNVEEIMSYLSELPILSDVSDEMALSEIGLDKPQQSIVFTYEDDSEYLLEFGDLSALGDGYYTLVNGHDVIVLPYSSINQLGLLFNAIIHPPTPTPEYTETLTEPIEPTNTPTP